MLQKQNADAGGDVYKEPRDVMTVAEFLDCARRNELVDDDGSGQLMKDDCPIYEGAVVPSDVLKHAFDWRGATHVEWFNK